MSGPGDIYDGSIDNRSAFPPLLSPSPATPASPPYLVSLLSRRSHRAQVTMIQDSLPSDEPFSTSANPGSVEMISEATESEANRPEPQESTDPHEPLSHASSDTVVEVVPKKTESEARITSLGSQIPPELFDDILFYVNVDRISQRAEYRRDNGGKLARNQGKPSPNDTLTDLKQCSLVCLFWANKCRGHMFSGRTLEIKSYEDAEIFRRYVVGGCQRLTLVNQLIHDIVVLQDYESRRSFLHLLYLPAIQDKLESLTIDGPVPVDFNPAKLDTPHWGIPPCTIVVPSSLLQNTKINLRDVHLPSFYHVAKYIKHFSRATEIEFLQVTWDGQMAPSLPHAPSTIVCQRRPRSLRIWNTGGCTNSAHLALTALMMNPNCPLHRLSDEERVRMFKFMTLLWGHEKYPFVCIGFDVSEQTTTMYLDDFHFVFEGAPPTDRSASALSMVGMHAYIDSLPVNFDALANHARTHPTIHALVLLLFSFDRLQESVKSFVQVLTLAAETIELVLAYEEVNERRAVGVDLVTLEPNGRIDTWDDEQSEVYWGRPMSLQMLQRQLKKQRRTSIH